MCQFYMIIIQGCNLILYKGYIHAYLAQIKLPIDHIPCELSIQMFFETLYVLFVADN